MVVAVSSARERQQVALPGLGYDGVVYIAANGFSGTGSLLYDGRAILTAAHVVEQIETADDVAVLFETPAGAVWRQVAAVVLHPEYDADNLNNDLAILWLESAAPANADRYDLYRDTDELTQAFTLVGYGNGGTGWNGEVDCTTCEPVRRYAENTFDATATQLKNALGPIMAWDPWDYAQLVADFDDGIRAHDALGQLIGVYDLGVGVTEGIIAAGDSGGPALIDHQVAGVASYGMSLYTAWADPDIDGVTNSTFGEMAAWQRVSSNQQWIDQTLRARQMELGAPTSVDEIQFSIHEGDWGIDYVWFWVAYSGPWLDDDQPVSVQYRTVDGTARAGEDYVPVSGQLRFYPGDTGIPIPVEIIGDTLPEPDETFYLEVYDPQGGTFPGGVRSLSAVRTIIDDDGYWFG